MERDKCFHFKLMVPPRVNPGQISAVKPQESVDDFGVMNTAQQTKGTSGKLYSKLFDEVEKIKCWKVQVDSETVQRERKLQENKRTIETQRKAIQDLQFGNESLSIKLEEQISENEDLRNKNNATRNLCNILKDTFQRSADKMHLFESEREETQQLFMENRENIQRMIAAFESLRLQAQFDRCEMQKVKEGLLQFDNLKEKFGEEINTKEQEVSQLQAALKEKEKELQAILLHLQEAQESCQHLQQAAQLHQDVLHSSHQERQALSEKLRTAEELLKESEENRKAISTALELNKEETAQIVLQKDASLEELHQTRATQEGQLAQAQATVQELQTFLARETERAQELEVKMVSVSEELQENRIRAGEMNKHNEEKDGQIQVLEEELKHQELLDEVAAKSSSEAELQKEVQDLKLTAGEAVRSREDAEIKCQHKIADMVALMEKHKNQYDKMLEAKDVELKEKKRSVVEADTSRTALELELEQSKIENDRLKNHLDQETKEGEKLIQKIAELKEELASVKTNPSNLLPKSLSKQLSDAAAASEGRCWDTPDRLSIKRNGFDFSKTKQKTPSQSAGKIQAFTPAVRETKSGDLQTPSWSYGTRVGETPRIKSYRIRTPPSTQKAGPWSQTTLELDPKSDSSEHADLLNQSPAVQKSPGNALKLAAMKRMRDAGWTAVTGSHKKKKAAEKIFA
ncbi:synaptonemal complex protein 1 [Osmerus mordax]|uniref:synaptonemal complex protein 1 n=1 Tax=Osmerus mordax TaxID=8014 RepID=UPI00350EA2DD